MIRRGLTIVLCGLDTAFAGFVAYSTLARAAEPATHGFDIAAGYAVLALFAVTTVPAIWLTLRRHRPNLALSLSLIFPMIFALLFLAVVIMIA